MSPRALGHLEPGIQDCENRNHFNAATLKPDIQYSPQPQRRVPGRPRSWKLPQEPPTPTGSSLKIIGSENTLKLQSFYDVRAIPGDWTADLCDVQVIVQKCQIRHLG